MIEFERTVGPKGQVVIPKEIRRITGIKPQSKVYIGIEDKKILIKPKRITVEEFLSIVPPEKRLSIKKLDLDKEYEEQLERWKK
ncbi:hypothetical protein A3K63_01900 [Candidatus Micrarchaeota archaeon RBG_16_49_10]|nr:MAG: hypothetical protein A3K63_01900 [Candidatus Micrarchaeota archaeon RBG_16_49_10]